MTERRVDMSAAVDRVLATASRDCGGQFVDGDGCCVECKIPVCWVDGVGMCVNFCCPIGQTWSVDLHLDDCCDWPRCNEPVFHMNTRRKTRRCHSHRHEPAWWDGTPRVEIPGQKRLL